MVARRRLQDAGAVVGLENLLGHQLHAEDQRNQRRQDAGRQPVPSPPEGHGQSGAHQSPRQGEEKVHREVAEGGLCVDVYHQLQIDQQHREDREVGTF